MEIKQEALVGTLESGDMLIHILPANELKITIESEVAKQFAQDIHDTVMQILNKLNISKIAININDKGALDCVLQARLKAAILRATDEQIDWEKLL